MTISEDRIERAARNICVRSGINPDGDDGEGVPFWKCCTDEAAFALEADAPFAAAEYARGRRDQRASIVAYLDKRLNRMGPGHEAEPYVSAVRNYVRDTLSVDARISDLAKGEEG